VIEEKLKHILPLVRKPIRYIGGEYNLVIKDKRKGRILFALVYPDVYEMGMSHYGLKVLYHYLNKREDVIVERSYAPWIDFAQKLKEMDIPLYSLESKRPLKEFHIIGFSIQSELNYTNILYILDLAHIPLLSTQRGPKDPLIIAGGPCATNPLPLSKFIDAFCIGDGEAILDRLIEVYKEWDRRDRAELLRLISLVPGVWVPQIDRDKRVERQIVNVLREEDFPYPPLLPITEITHDRLTVEIARGCVQGCRFCQAGMINRPLRFRRPEEVVRLAERGIRSTGWEEVSLLSLSALDYPQLTPLLGSLASSLEGRKVAISLPSMRGDSFNCEIAEFIKVIRKTGLTFAPETGSERLRSIINKPLKEEDFLRNLKSVFDMGWRGVKLYFMIGLPKEREEDIDSSIRMIRETLRLSRRRVVKLNISPFIPKPHTPFQWVEFPSIEVLRDKIEYLRARIPRRYSRLKIQRPEVSFIEGVLARGDESLADIILDVYKQNGFFQEWSEFFNFRLWMETFEKRGIDPKSFTKERSLDRELPWDFIDVGVRKEFLKDEYRKAMEEKLTPDCLKGKCSKCGVCETPPDFSFLYEKGLTYGRRPTKVVKPSQFRLGFRVKYTVGGRFQYASHLDRIRAIYRALRRSELPIAYTLGFSPKPLVSFGPPLSLGISSKGEYLDLMMAHSYSGNIIRDLNPFLPQGLSLVTARTITGSVPSLSKEINLLEYRIEIDDPDFKGIGRNPPAIYRIEWESERVLKILLRINPPVHFFEVLKELLNMEESKIRNLSIERIECYILRGDKLYTPLEVL